MKSGEVYEVENDQSGTPIISGPGFNNCWYRNSGYPFKFVVPVDVTKSGRIKEAMNLAYQEGRKSIQRELRNLIGETNENN